jgi:hypothetical protein
MKSSGHRIRRVTGQDLPVSVAVGSGLLQRASYQQRRLLFTAPTSGGAAIAPRAYVQP